MKLWKTITLLGALTVAGWAMPSTSSAHDEAFRGSVYSDHDRYGWADRDHDYGYRVDHDGRRCDDDRYTRYRRSDWYPSRSYYEPGYRSYYRDYRPYYRPYPPQPYSSGYWGRPSTRVGAGLSLRLN